MLKKFENDTVKNNKKKLRKNCKLSKITKISTRNT